MQKNPLLQVQQYGQSIWLDFIRRGIIDSGTLKRFIDEDGLRGVTSNPSIFKQAIAGSDDYTLTIKTLAAQGKSAPEIYEILAVEDIQRAADEFRPVYDSTGGRDGFVSLEVSPLLARDTDSTVQEAHHLWEALDRPNVLIKVPGTKEGLPAIRRLIGEGINVNVTLLFSLDRYADTAEAYISGLEDALRSGRPIDGIASVASFFLSRIDVLVDPMLDELKKAGGEKAAKAESLTGESAIASAKLAYRMYQEIYSSDRWRKLVDKGAKTQRLLWASTSTKNPAYPVLKYVEPLIGPDTVNTLPLETFEAYRNQGKPAARLEDDIDKTKKILNMLAEVGIDLDDVCDRLEAEGIEKFVAPFHELIAALEAAS